MATNTSKESIEKLVNAAPPKPALPPFPKIPQAIKLHNPKLMDSWLEWERDVENWWKALLLTR